MKKETIRRLDLFDELIANPDSMSMEYEKCKRDIFHFARNWAWTFDPRTDTAHLPFELYDYQIETLKWLDDRYYNAEVGVIEKSRDMGVTWLLVLWTVHKWLFTSGFTCLFGSKTEGDVDDNSVDSIFGKIRYILSRTPDFLKPDMTKRINGKRDADSYLSIINPETMNEISGDSANANFGRSGRRSVVFLDEFAFVEQSDKIWSAISEVSNTIIPVSTPNGKGNHFYTLRSKGTIPVLSLHWSRHPNKDNAWYEGKKKTMEPHQVAQELDIDYSSSKSGRVYKRFEKRFHVAQNIIHPNPHFQHFLTLDFGIADAMCLVMGQVDALGNIEIYSCYDTTDQDIDYFIPLMKGERPDRIFWEYLSEAEQRRVSQFLTKSYTDENGNVLSTQFESYGDFAGTQRGANSRYSIRDRLRQAGINLKVTSVQDFATRIQTLDNLFKLKEDKITGELRSRFLISPDCEKLIDSIMNYVWDKEDVNNPNLKPKHDWASHFVSALEFLAINKFPIRDQGKVTIQKVR